MSKTEPYGDLYEEAEATIEAANISAVEHILLLTLLDDAVKQDEACRYILDRVSEGSHLGISLEDVLLGIKRDLITLAKKCCLTNDNISADLQASLSQRQNNKCYVSGWDTNLKPVYIIPPSILEDEDLKPQERLRPLFKAVVSAELASKLFTYLDLSKGVANQLGNLWLLNSHARAAFQRGHFVVTKYERTRSLAIMVRINAPEIPGLRDVMFNAKPSTPDEEGLPLPEGFLLAAHKAISVPLHFLLYEHFIRQGWPPTPKDHWYFNHSVRCLSRMLLSILPTHLCLMLYKFLLKILNHFYLHKDPHFKFLLFGLCLKTGSRVTKDEANALLLVEKHTSIPAPRLINFTVDKREKEGCNPCNPKSDFLDHIIVKQLRNHSSISPLYEKKHRIFFTHADLHLSNLMVQGGRLCGLIDWENSGFRPEYWEYTKAVWSYMGGKRSRHMYSLAFDENYEAELKGEREIWRQYPTL